MPIVRGDPTADIKLAISAELDKASAKKVQDAIKSMSAEERAAIEGQIQGERRLAAVEAERARAAAQERAEEAAANKKRLDAIKAQQAAQDKYRAGLAKSREEAEKLAQVSQRIGLAGAAILAPFIAASAKFAQGAAQSDSVAREYRASMQSLEESTMRVGRATVELLNPALSATAKAMGDISKILDNNPALLAGVLGVGAGMVTLGAVGNLVALINGTVATMALLSGVTPVAGVAAGAAGTAAGGAVAGGAAAGGGIAAAATAAAPYVIAALLAAGVVVAVNLALEKTTGTSLVDMAKAQAEFVSRLPEVLAGKININDLAASVLNGKTSSPASSTSSSLAGIGNTITPGPRRRDFETIAKVTERNAAVINVTKKFQAENDAVEKEYREKRLSALKSYEAERTSIEKSIAESTRSYLLSEQYAYEDYYNARKDASKAAGIEAERREEDHQRTLMKIQKDSNARIDDLVTERDALGIVRERRAAEAQREEADDNFRIEERRRNQDLAERLRIMEREFSMTRQRKLAEFEYNISTKNAELDAAQKMYNAIVEMSTKAVNEVRKALGLPLYGAWTGGSGGGGGGGAGGTGTVVPVRAFENGGPIRGTGPAIVHDQEFMLSRPTRQMAENLIGGNLTQASLLEALRNGKRATINNSFGNTLTERRVAEMIEMSAQELMKVLTRSLA